MLNKTFKSLSVKKYWRIIAVILIISGIIMVGTGYHGLTQIPVKNSEHQINSGEYESDDFNFSSNYELMMITNSSNYGLVKESMAKYISPGNISKYAIKPVSSSDGTLVYKNLTGNYVFIAFNSQKPLMDYEFAKITEFNDVKYSGYLAALGALFTGSGIILLFIYIVYPKLKNNNKKI